MLLILDLDETLIHSTDRESTTNADFRVGEYAVKRRPHLDEFLTFCCENFKVAVWTSAGEAYATEIVENIFPDSPKLEFFWTSNRCTLKYDPETQFFYTLKNLQKVKKKGFTLERVLMIDDDRDAFRGNYGNYILIRKFEGDENDRELLLLKEYLPTLLNCKNV